MQSPPVSVLFLTSLSSVPTECRLISSPEPWQCIITLRFITDVNGQPLRQIRNEPFGGVIHEKRHVEERIRRAQRALLNPSTGLRDFLEGHDEDPLDRELSFSKNCVCLEISGPDVADLSFVDLPGRFRSLDLMAFVVTLANLDNT